MGTRGLTVVISDAKNVIAQYGQWDHYPQGQGIDALTFLRDTEAVARLRENVSRIVPADEEYRNSLPVTGWKKVAPQLSRDMGTDILWYVADAATGPIYLQDDSDFADDGLFCEGIFTVNLDENTYQFSQPGGFAGPTYSLDALPSDEDFISDNEIPED